MQRGPSFFHGKDPSTGRGVGGGNIHNTQFGGHFAYGAAVATPPFGAALTGTNHDCLLGPLDGMEFQPSVICPQNFIIFDQTENKSRIMFHPALAPKLNYPYDFNDCVDNAYTGGSAPEKSNENRDDISSLKENTADIDALLNSDEDDDDEEDDTVSTGRSPANWKGSSPYPSSSEDEWNSSSSKKSFSSGASSSSGDGRKRGRVRKMVKALRGIIPGGDSMDTPAVLDEAVKYLKSLKVEVKKLGVQNFKNY